MVKKIVFGIIAGSCFLGLIAIIGVIVRSPERQKPADLLPNNTQAVAAPSPELTDAEKIQRARAFFALGSGKDADIHVGLNLLKSIPKTAKEYREGLKVTAEITRFLSDRNAEHSVLGDRPISGAAEVKEYLGNVLNDYDSSEFIRWTEVEKVYLKKEPYWRVGLKLRAKNAFGAYIVKDVVFYIRNGQVVKAQGL